MEREKNRIFRMSKTSVPGRLFPILPRQTLLISRLKVQEVSNREMVKDSEKDACRTVPG